MNIKSMTHSVEKLVDLQFLIGLTEYKKIKRKIRWPDFWNL